MMEGVTQLTKAYFAIRDADGNKHVLPPFVVKDKLNTSTVPEKNDVKNTSVNLKLENVDEVLNYLKKHKDIIKSGAGKVELTITPEKSTLGVYNNNQE